MKTVVGPNVCELPLSVPGEAVIGVLQIGSTVRAPSLLYATVNATSDVNWRKVTYFIITHYVP